MGCGSSKAGSAVDTFATVVPPAAGSKHGATPAASPSAAAAGATSTAAAATTAANATAITTGDTASGSTATTGAAAAITSPGTRPGTPLASPAHGSGGGGFGAGPSPQASGLRLSLTSGVHSGSGGAGAGSALPPLGSPSLAKRGSIVDPRALLELPAAPVLAAALNDAAYFATLLATICARAGVTGPAPAAPPAPSPPTTTTTATTTMPPTPPLGRPTTTPTGDEPPALAPAAVAAPPGVAAAATAAAAAAVAAADVTATHSSKTEKTETLVNLALYTRMVEGIAFARDERLSHGDSVLEIACAAGSVDVVRILLRAMPSLLSHEKAGTGNSLLHFTALGPRHLQALYDTIRMHVLHDTEVAPVGCTVAAEMGLMGTNGSSSPFVATPAFAAAAASARKRSAAVQYLQQVCQLSQSGSGGSSAGGSPPAVIGARPAGSTASGFGPSTSLASNGGFTAPPVVPAPAPAPAPASSSAAVAAAAAAADDSVISMPALASSGSFFGTGLGLGAPVSMDAAPRASTLPAHPPSNGGALHREPSSGGSDLAALALANRMKHARTPSHTGLSSLGASAAAAASASATANGKGKGGGWLPPVTEPQSLADLVHRFPPRSVERTAEVLKEAGADLHRRNLFGKVARDLAAANAGQVVPEAAQGIASGSGTSLLLEGKLMSRLLAVVPVDWEAVTAMLGEGVTPTIPAAAPIPAAPVNKRSSGSAASR